MYPQQAKLFTANKIFRRCIHEFLTILILGDKIMSGKIDKCLFNGLTQGRTDIKNMYKYFLNLFL